MWVKERLDEDVLYSLKGERKVGDAEKCRLTGFEGCKLVSKKGNTEIEILNVCVSSLKWYITTIG